MANRKLIAVQTMNPFMSFSVMLSVGKASVERRIQIGGYVVWELGDVHGSCPVFLYIV